MTGWQPQQPPPPGGAGAATQQAPKTQTLYDVLQVNSTAHPTIIRYAYRFLAGMYHPDNADSGNNEMFRVVSDAFRTLSDPGKRAAYDAQHGLKAAQGAAGAQAFGAQPNGGGLTGGLNAIPKTGLSYTEVELRLAVLQVLLTARKKRAQTGGASAKVLMDVLNVDMAEMEFVLWYLREKGLISRNEASFMINVPGVDYLVDSLSKTQSIDDGGKSDKYKDIKLPATI